ncbi:pyrroline-5-carboxylate reductase [Litorimonas haliclonae]|uniref:pyrroline-5-carboxylate reductase n=1 Tax=Litorimonas haliclonae TaxID=2081977 RepID=UPI0039EDECEF
MVTKQTSHKVLMVGCGKMGGALLEQWIKSDKLDFTVVDPMAESLPEGARLLKDQDALKNEMFDLIIVAIKPQLIEKVLPSYSKRLNKDGLVLSMAAGFSATGLGEVMETDRIARIMPNLPSMIGKGVAGLFAMENVSQTYRDLLEDMMELAGTSVWVDSEDGLDRITAVAGSGPGYVFEFARTYVEAAESLGFSNEQARDLVLGTILGTIEMAQGSNETLETLRNNVTSKNGTTEAGLNALNQDGTVTRKLKETVDAAYNRAVELR